MSEITHNTEVHAEDAHDHNEQFSFVGRTFPVPVYTGVFVLLGALTLIEVLLSRVDRSGILIAIMLALAITKSGLVVWFYMHLNKDSRIFLACLLIPFILVIICVWFLSIVPSFSYP